MFDSIVSSLVANSYGAMAPMMNLAQARCTSNGVEIACPDFGPLMALFGGFMLIALVVTVVMIVATWKVFTKAKKPGWASLIPIYNIVVLLEITGKPLWWIVLSFIPIANIVVSVLIMDALSKSFGKGTGFTIGLLVLPFIFFPILGFGKAEYKGSSVTPVPPTTPPIPPTMTPGATV